MGVGIGGISSCRNEHTEPNAPTLVGQNPDPKNFIIKDSLEIDKYVILLVEYPDCINYEGLKVLVYQGISLVNLQKLTSLDPHFCKECISPIARFAPEIYGQEGMAHARVYVEALI